MQFSGEEEADSSLKGELIIRLCKEGSEEAVKGPPLLSLLFTTSDKIDLRTCQCFRIRCDCRIRGLDLFSKCILSDSIQF